MEHFIKAIRAGKVAPESSEAHGSPQTAGPKSKQTLSTDAISAGIPEKDIFRENDSATEEREFANLRAKYAKLGHTLVRTARDGQETFYAVRWGMSRHLPTIYAAKRFLDEIGGRHGV